MANITRTFLYPVPTDWMGQEQDDFNVGVATYQGPETIALWMEYEIDGVTKSNRINRAWSTDDPQYIQLRDSGVMPIDNYEVILNAGTHPMHAAVHWGGIEGPDEIEVVCGPGEDPNPIIKDPCHFTEVFDLRTFDYDPETKTWGTPEFSCDVCGDGQPDVNFGWDWVRQYRDSMLKACDHRIAPDAPESYLAGWSEYRQKLRDLPEAWAGVGTATHLICWPRDPEQQEYDRQALLDPPHLRP